MLLPWYSLPLQTNRQLQKELRTSPHFIITLLSQYSLPLQTNHQLQKEPRTSPHIIITLLPWYFLPLQTNRQLQKEPSIEIQQLQEELIAAKLREAEANLSMKELRQRVTDLDKHWQVGNTERPQTLKGLLRMSKITNQRQPLCNDIMWRGSKWLCFL